MTPVKDWLSEGGESLLLSPSCPKMFSPCLLLIAQDMPLLLPSYLQGSEAWDPANLGLDSKTVAYQTQKLTHPWLSYTKID